MSTSLGAEGSERALVEFNKARDALIWMKNFFGNTLQSFLSSDLQVLRKWSPQQEIPQPGYAPGAIRMTPTVTRGVDAIVVTVDVRATMVVEGVGVTLVVEGVALVVEVKTSQHQIVILVLAVMRV